MEKINLMVNGLPGNVAKTIVENIKDSKIFNIIPISLTGPDTEEDYFEIKDLKIELVKPQVRDERIKDFKSQYKDFYAIDYTHPTAINSNCEFYCKNEIPFVMGTTGGDRDKLFKDVENSQISAVIAPNMAKQIVGFQAMMEYAANNFPGIFKDYTLELKESHQFGKADTSGTAKAMVGYFNELGLDFKKDDIKMERDPKKQEEEWKIPKDHINGHAWHTYTLNSNDETVKFEFTHNINGRDIYTNGTLDAVVFLIKKLDSKIKGKVFSMIDVLKG